MSEIHFIVEESPEGGYVAHAVDVDIFTEADDLPALRMSVRDAVSCHFEPADKPSLIRLHITREEAMAA
ncbi:2-oxoisovalerate dehydrogenase [Rhabdochromatium marinum]|uniref:2-oxoisovalerate dehydrogenase n=1 Tax=Rhabdochromatium marinum TaxID=48729 RepID=UPI001905A064|nr:2-oxoisovalerate dehydrogenase [Rhabdochromatium marinum]MBK1648772.1 2-oxoisovalerate dehydrogenase [Rhabdochromatium marinum]